MHSKLFITLSLFYFLASCSNSPSPSQALADTRMCSAISYGNNHIANQSTDNIYQQCMRDKKKIRDKKSDDDRNLAIIEFVSSIFWSTEK